jgi:hypothetical protein
MTKQVRKNQSQGINRFKTNEELLGHLKKGMKKAGFSMKINTILNRFRHPEKITLIP